MAGERELGQRLLDRAPPPWPASLTEPLGETAAEISRTTAEVDGVKGVFDPCPGLMQAVETGEVLQILGHGQTQVEPW